MFSNNGKISEKQLACLVLLPMFAAGVLILPHLFAYLYGDGIIIGAAAFIAACGIYVSLLLFSGSGYKRKKINGSYKLVAVIDVFRNFIRLVFYILLSVSVLLEGQVPFMEKKLSNSAGNLMMLIPLAVVALYGALRGLECTGRLYEMLAWTLVFPYILMIVFGIKDMDYGVLIPGEIPALSRIILYSVGLITFILPVENYLRLKLNVERKKDGDRRIFLKIIICALVICVVSLMIVGIYGITGAGTEPMVSVAIMRYIDLPFSVLQRFDVLMVWFFMTGCFILISNTLSEIKMLTEDLLCLGKHMKKTVTFILCVILVTALVTAVKCPDYESTLAGFLIYGALFDVPVSIILPLIRWLDCKKLKRFLFTVMLMCCSFFMAGCNGKIENIEQRDYATVLMITLNKEVTPVFGYSTKTEEKRYDFTLGVAKEKRTGEKIEAENIVNISADSFEELSKIYGSIKGKDLSLSHLKLIMAGYEYDSNNDHVFVPGENFKDLIYEMDEQDEVARTCPLVLVYNRDAIEEYMKNSKEPIGTYFNDLVQTAKREGKDIPKFMDYLKAFREGTQVMVYELKNVGEDMMLFCRGICMNNDKANCQ